MSTFLPPVVPPQAQTYFLALSASALSCSCGLACALGSQFGSCVEVSKNQHRAVLRGLLLEFYWAQVCARVVFIFNKVFSCFFRRIQTHLSGIAHCAHSKLRDSEWLFLSVRIWIVYAAVSSNCWPLIFPCLSAVNPTWGTFLKINLYFYHMNVIRMSVHMCTWSPWRSEEASDPMDRSYVLLWTTVWVPGIKPRSFARADSVLGDWAISLAPVPYFSISDISLPLKESG